jgi:hypothetical protein
MKSFGFNTSKSGTPIVLKLVESIQRYQEVNRIPPADDGLLNSYGARRGGRRFSRATGSRARAHLICTVPISQPNAGRHQEKKRAFFMQTAKRAFNDGLPCVPDIHLMKK